MNVRWYDRNDKLKKRRFLDYEKWVGGIVILGGI